MVRRIHGASCWTRTIASPARIGLSAEEQAAVRYCRDVLIAAGAMTAYGLNAFSIDDLSEIALENDRRGEAGGDAAR